MIAWLHPAALAALAALGGPILVHLLRRQRAVRLPFPSVRFIRPSRAAAIRLRLPSDLAFLAARLAVIALAAAAWAQPLVVTGSRRAAWDAALVRAVVIDASDSMRADAGDRRSRLDAARARADAEMAGVTTAARIEHADLRRAIGQAAAALAAAPPSRRELVVISDFHQGSLSAEDLGDVPATMGLRLLRVGESPQEVRFAGAPRFGTDRLSTTEVELRGPATAVTVAAGGHQGEGLRLGGGDPAEIGALLETVADAGAPAPSPSQPITIAFGAGLPQAARAGGGSIPGWAVETAGRLLRDADLQAVAAETEASRSIDEAPPWLTVVRGKDGRALMRTMASADGLVLEVAASPASLFAAAAVRAALVARSGPSAMIEHEILTIPADTLRAWSRPPGAVADDGWRRSDLTDARWCWGAVLLLLVVETAAVRRRRPAAREVRADAA